MSVPCICISGAWLTVWHMVLSERKNKRKEGKREGRRGGMEGRKGRRKEGREGGKRERHKERRREGEKERKKKIVKWRRGRGIVRREARQRANGLKDSEARESRIQKEMTHSSGCTKWSRTNFRKFWKDKDWIWAVWCVTGTTVGSWREY